MAAKIGVESFEQPFVLVLWQCFADKYAVPEFSTKLLVRPAEVNAFFGPLFHLSPQETRQLMKLFENWKLPVRYRPRAGYELFRGADVV